MPLYLVTQKGLEDENFRVGTISYGLQSVIVRIEKMFVRNPRVFKRISGKPSVHDRRILKFRAHRRQPVERAHKTLSVVQFSERSNEIWKRYSKISKKNPHFTCEFFKTSRWLIAKHRFLASQITPNSNPNSASCSP